MCMVRILPRPVEKALRSTDVFPTSPQRPQACGLDHWRDTGYPQPAFIHRRSCHGRTECPLLGTVSVMDHDPTPAPDPGATPETAGTAPSGPPATSPAGPPPTTGGGSQPGIHSNVGTAVDQVRQGATASA